MPDLQRRCGQAPQTGALSLPDYLECTPNTASVTVRRSIQGVGARCQVRVLSEVPRVSRALAVGSASFPAYVVTGRFVAGDGSTDMSSGSRPRVDITGGICGSGRSGRVGLRLALKPKAALMGAVDGAWWPRTTNPLAEFPAMIAGVELRRGPVDRVAFSSIDWDDAPDRMVVADATIELEGFHSLDRHTVWVSGANWHRMVLLVIPPQADEQAAAAAIALAASGDNADEATQILIASGVDRHGGADDRPRVPTGPWNRSTNGPIRRGAGRVEPPVPLRS